MNNIEQIGNEFIIAMRLYGIDVVITAFTREGAIEAFEAELLQLEELFGSEVPQWQPVETAA